MPWDVKDQRWKSTTTSRRQSRKTPRPGCGSTRCGRAPTPSWRRPSSDATLVYRAGEVQQRQTVHWELVKFTACWLTLVETNFEKDGEDRSFPTRKKRNEEVSKDAFARAWNQLLPPEITDEWMAAVLDANPLWYEMLRLWIPLWWLRQWMPEKLEVKEDERDRREARGRQAARGKLWGKM